MLRFTRVLRLLWWGYSSFVHGRPMDWGMWWTRLIQEADRAWSQRKRNSTKRQKPTPYEKTSPSYSKRRGLLSRLGRIGARRVDGKKLNSKDRPPDTTSSRRRFRLTAKKRNGRG